RPAGPLHRRAIHLAQWRLAHGALRKQRYFEAKAAGCESERRVVLIAFTRDAQTALDDVVGDVPAMQEQIKRLRLIGEYMQLDIGIGAYHPGQYLADQARL